MENVPAEKRVQTFLHTQSSMRASARKIRKGANLNSKTFHRLVQQKIIIHVSGNIYRLAETETAV